MNSLDLLPWQESQWRRIVASRRAGRLAHAFLVAGPRGVGKLHFARRVAAWLLCESGRDDPCGDCRGCRQFGADAHPNFFSLQPEEDKRDIAVDAIRELSGQLALTAHYGGAKVAIIAPADALNPSGVNALLKTIEEPPANSHLLLLTERLMLLAPTLRSRCQILRFATPPAAQALAWMRQSIPDADEAALQRAHGAPLRALELLEESSAAQQATWSQLMLAIAAGQESPLTLAAGMDRRGAQALLEWLLSWAALRQGKLLSGAADRPRSLPSNLSVAGLDRLMQDCVGALRRLHASAPPQLTIESVIISFWQSCRSPSEEMRA